MKPIRWLALAPLAVLAVLASLYATWPQHPDAPARPDALVGHPLPAVSVAPLNGGAPVSLAGAIKGPALLNVFAAWCVPCRVEHPRLMALKARGVRIVGLAWKDDPAKTRGLLRDLGDPFDLVLSDRPNRAGQALGLWGVPDTYLIDARGVVVEVVAAPMTPEDAERLYQRVKALR
jgi:cytochrome c biogenesis protein CcmG/thiol:disulfide interchange protein DsbE